MRLSGLGGPLGLNPLPMFTMPALGLLATAAATATAETVAEANADTIVACIRYGTIYDAFYTMHHVWFLLIFMSPPLPCARRWGGRVLGLFAQGVDPRISVNCS